MNLTVSKSTLHSALQICSKVISKNATLPITECFKIDVVKDKLTITTTDLENTMIKTIDVECTETKSFCIESKTILELLGTLQELPLNLLIEGDKLKILAGFGEYNFMLQDAKEYPKIQELSEKLCRFNINGKILYDCIDTCAFAMANDELRPVMNSICIDFVGDTLTFAATDAHKLVKLVTKYPDVDMTEKDALIIPRKPINTLLQLLSKEDKNVIIKYDNKFVCIELESSTLICRLSEGKYPNYRGVIPPSQETKLTVDRSALINALKRISIFSNKASSLIAFDIKANEVTLTAQDLDFSVSAEEKISCNYAGTEIKMGYKASFLIEILQKLDSKEVLFELNGESKASLILPFENKENEELTMLLMPMLLNS